MTGSKYDEDEQYINYFKSKERKKEKIEYVLLKIKEIENQLKELVKNIKIK